MSYWKLKGGRYGGITARGKRFIVDSLAKARAKVGKSKTKRSKTKNKKGGRKVAKRRNFTIPIAPAAGLAAGFTSSEFYGSPIDQIAKGNLQQAINGIKANYTGFDHNNNFKISQLKHGIAPLLVGFIIHWLASKVGVNRMLGRMGIPLVRI